MIDRVISAAGVVGAIASTAAAQFFFEPIDVGDTFASRQVLPPATTVVVGTLSATDATGFELTITTDDTGAPRGLTAGQVTRVFRASVPGLGFNDTYNVFVDNRASGVDTIMLDLNSNFANDDNSPFANFFGSGLTNAQTTPFGGVELFFTGSPDTTFVGAHSESGRFDVLIDTNDSFTFIGGDADFYEIQNLPAGGIVSIGFFDGGATRVGFFQPDGTLFKSDIASSGVTDPTMVAATTLGDGNVVFGVTVPSDAAFNGSHDSISFYDLDVFFTFPEQLVEPTGPPLTVEDVDALETLLTNEDGLIDVALPEGVFDAFDRATIYELFPLVPTP
ncbi:MAG: hypothetical protein AAGI30_06455 [Planctomycetota bacterium]